MSSSCAQVQGQIQLRRKRHVRDCLDSEIQSIHRPKKPKLKPKSIRPAPASRGIVARESELCSARNEASDYTASRAAPTTFMDSRPDSRDSDRSIGSYQQYVESIVHDVEYSHDTRYTSFHHGHAFVNRQQWSADIPDEERIVELDEDGSEVEDCETTRTLDTRDSKTLTLANILNPDHGPAVVAGKKSPNNESDLCENPKQDVS